MFATADQLRQAGASTNLSGCLLRLQRLEAEVEEVEQRWQQATDAEEKSFWKDHLDMVQDTKELLLQEFMLVRRAAVLMQQQADRAAAAAAGAPDSGQSYCRELQANLFAQLFKDVMRHKQAGYSRLVDGGSQDADKKRQ